MSETRKLGNWETLCKVYHEDYMCSGMVMQYARIKGPVTEAKLRNVLASLQNRHPLLRAKMVSGSQCGEFQIVSHGSINQEEREKIVPMTYLQKVSDTHWQEVLEEEIAGDFADGAPLWRLTFLHDKTEDQRHDLVFMFHHSISDGLSNAHVVKDLAAGLEALEANHDKSFEELALLPPIDDLIKKESEGDSATFASERPTVVPWKLYNKSEMPDRRTRYIYRKIERQDMKNLIAAGKQRGVTVNSMLTAALTLANFLEQGEVKEETSFLSHTAISLRNECEPPVEPHQFGCYVMVVPSIYTCNKGQDFWDYAKNCGARLRESINGKKAEGFLPASFSEQEIRESMKGAIHEAHNSGAIYGGPVISNLGIIDVNNKGLNYKVEDIYFGTNQVAGFYSLCLWVFSANGNLHCAFSYIDTMFGKDLEEGKSRAESMVGRFQMILQEATNSQYIL